MEAVTQASARIALWDNLKFILILLVVIGHMADEFAAESYIGMGIFFYIFLFHMPLFIFIAGLFHSDKNILSKCVFYLSLGFFMKVVFFIVYRYTGRAAAFSVLSEYDIPWYAFAMAGFIFFTWLFRRGNKKFILIAGIVLACFAGYDAAIGDFLIVSRMIVFMPCYMLGAVMDKERILQWKQKHRIPAVIVSIAILVCVFLACRYKLGFLYPRFRPLLSGRNPFPETILSYGALARLGCYVAAWAFGFALIMLTPDRKVALLTKMGGKTLNVFVWHWPVYVILERIFHFSQLAWRGIGGIVVFLLIGAGITVFLSLDKGLYAILEKIRKCSFSFVR